jgi:hypothetical protein
MMANTPPSFSARIPTRCSSGSPAFRTPTPWTRRPTRSFGPLLVSEPQSRSIRIVGDLIGNYSEPVAQPPVVSAPLHHQKVTKAHIRRPRNQFIIYRQWMSAKIHASNPGVTAACICKSLTACFSPDTADIG